jgi:hypothetical protein
MMRLWAKREEQIRGVVESTAGLYGDLQGIAVGECAQVMPRNIDCCAKRDSRCLPRDANRRVIGLYYWVNLPARLGLRWDGFGS